jgi:hypothetical protein
MTKSMKVTREAITNTIYLTKDVLRYMPPQKVFL